MITPENNTQPGPPFKHLDQSPPGSMEQQGLPPKPLMVVTTDEIAALENPSSLSIKKS